MSVFVDDNNTQNFLLIGGSVIILAICGYTIYRGWNSYDSDGEFSGTILLILGILGCIVSIFFIGFSVWKLIQVYRYPKSARDYKLNSKGHWINPKDFSQFKPMNKNPNWLYKNVMEIIEKPGNKLYIETENGQMVSVVRVYRDLYKDYDGNYYRCERGNCLKTVDENFINDRLDMAENKEIKKVLRGAPGPNDPLYPDYLEAGSTSMSGVPPPFQLRALK